MSAPEQAAALGGAAAAPPAAQSAPAAARAHTYAHDAAGTLPLPLCRVDLHARRVQRALRAIAALRVRALRAQPRCGRGARRRANDRASRTVAPSFDSAACALRRDALRCALTLRAPLPRRQAHLRARWRRGAR
jgi:hypothetical protein